MRLEWVGLPLQAITGFGIKYNGSLNYGNGGGTGKEETQAKIMAKIESTTALVTKGRATETVGVLRPEWVNNGASYRHAQLRRELSGSEWKKEFYVVLNLCPMQCILTSSYHGMLH